jgi:hypothetical protein
MICMKCHKPRYYGFTTKPDSELCTCKGQANIPVEGDMTAKTLLEDYQAKLKQLQEECRHENVSDWMPQYWAPGHTGGQMVRVCEVCAKVVETKNQQVYLYTAISVTRASKLSRMPWRKRIFYK